jgi:MFS family permease
VDPRGRVDGTVLCANRLLRHESRIAAAVDLNSTATDLDWVISVYMLALGAFMVPAGRIGDIFGRRRALQAGIALFGLSSALCALAPSATLVGSLHFAPCRALVQR